MRKLPCFLLAAAALFILQDAHSQVHIGVGVGPAYPYSPYGGYGYGYPRPPHYPRQRQQKGQQEPPFKTQVHFSLGYGFPNLDKDQMAQFYGYSQANITQTGPVTGALDVQFSRTSSIGLMVSHGETSANYYQYDNYQQPADITGRLRNWSVMLNLVNYIPASERITPYIRTAIGLNIWDQQYTDYQGNKLNYIDEPPQLAYQVSLGSKFYFTKNSALFIEAGYGKYILHGGLSFRL